MIPVPDKRIYGRWMPGRCMQGASARHFFMRRAAQDEPPDSMMAYHGKFSGIWYYVAMIGKKNPALKGIYRCYGEKIVFG